MGRDTIKPCVRVFRSMSQAFRLVPGTGYQVSVPATWHRVPDTRYRIRAEGRIPRTEDRPGHWETRTRGMQYFGYTTLSTR